MGEKDKDKRDRSKRSERSSSRGLDRASSSTDVRGRGGRQSSSRNLRSKSASRSRKEDDKKAGSSDNKDDKAGGRGTLERQTSNNEDSMAMLLGLAGKKQRKRGGSDSSSSSSSSSSSASSRGPPLTGEKPKAKNVKLNPKLVGLYGADEGGKQGSSRSLSKDGGGKDGHALDLSDAGKRKVRNDDSSQYTNESSTLPGKGDDEGSTLNMSRLAFPTVKSNSKNAAPAEPNTFISRPDLRQVDQSVNLRDLEAGKRKGPSLADAAPHLGESGNTQFSSGAFSTSSGGSGRNSFVRNKKNPYLKVSAWEQFSYYVKDFCRSMSDCLCNKWCIGPLLVVLVVGVVLPILFAKKIVKSSKLIVPDAEMEFASLGHPIIETVEVDGVTYLAPLFSEEEAANRMQVFQKIVVEHRMNSTDLAAKEALRWLAQFDPEQLDIETDEGDILQRYALAVLFFATHDGTMGNRTTDEALSRDGHDDNATATAVKNAVRDEQDERRIDSYGANWMIYDICVWEGIVCDETNTRVIHLDMPGATLQGTLPCELALLKELTKIDLSHNYLEGVIPASWPVHLTKLQYLMLQDNLLSGSLPSELGSWTSLASINLSENKIGGSLPAGIDLLTDLTALFLHDNLISGSVPDMKGLKDLEYLYLNNNDLTGSLSHDLFKDKFLVDVRLEYNSLTGAIPDQMHKLHRLEVLSLGNNDMNGTVPDVFHHTKSLVALDLHKNQFSGTLPSSMRELSNLEHLLLDTNRFTGELPVGLPEMTSLRTLVLHHNSFSGSIPSRISELSNLRDLWLNHNLFFGTIPDGLGRVSSLVNIYLHNNQLTGSIPSNMHELENLGSLRLYNTNITGEIGPELCDMKKESSLSFLAVDCVEKVACTCCDKCY